MRAYAKALLPSIVVFRAWSAVGCQCGYMPTAREALQTADVVFAGTVVSRTPVLVRVLGDLIVAERDEFLVQASWRGTGAQRIALLQGLSNCSNYFEVGKRYLVFADRDAGVPGGFTSTICSPTRPLSSAEVAVPDIGQPLASSPQSDQLTEGWIRRSWRHGYASLLCGIWLIRAHVQVFRYSHGWSTHILLIAPAAMLVGFSVLAYFVVRRKFHLVAWLALPIIGLVTISVVVEGYLFLRSYPLCWYLLDRLPT